MVVAEVVAIAGVVASIFTSIYGLFKRKEVKTVSAKLEAVADGLVIIEQAIDENKDTLKKAGGDKVVLTIKSYGDDARAIVNMARDLAHELEDDKLD